MHEGAWRREATAETYYRNIKRAPSEKGSLLAAFQLSLVLHFVGSEVYGHCLLDVCPTYVQIYVLVPQGTMRFNHPL